MHLPINIIKILIFASSLACLTLDSFVLSIIPAVGVGVYAFGIFIELITMIVNGYYLISMEKRWNSVPANFKLDYAVCGIGAILWLIYGILYFVYNEGMIVGGVYGIIITILYIANAILLYQWSQKLNPGVNNPETGIRVSNNPGINNYVGTPPGMNMNNSMSSHMSSPGMNQHMNNSPGMNNMNNSPGYMNNSPGMNNMNSSPGIGISSRINNYPVINNPGINNPGIGINNSGAEINSPGVGINNPGTHYNPGAEMNPGTENVRNNSGEINNNAGAENPYLHGR
jgi:hypothetical protein